MKQHCSFCHWLLAAGAFVVVSDLALASGAAAQSNCFRDWSVAGPIVRREGLATVERVNQLAKARKAGVIVKSTLCRERGRFVYRLLVKKSRGALRTLVVDARRPFER